MQIFTKINKSKLLLLVVIIVITLPAVYKLIRPGFFPMYDDMQVIRVQQMDECIKDFQIPCRWVPDLGYGYGYPLFQYYAPFPYYVMEAVHLLGFSFIASVKIGFILSVFFSALFFYVFVRKIFSAHSSIAATVLYIYAPIRASDLYVRGAMGELWGMAVLPLVFWAIENLFKKADKKSILLLAFSIALFLTTHNLTVLMATPAILLWVFIRIFWLTKKPKTKQTFIKLIYAGVLGLALAGFYIIPLAFERNLVSLETLTQGYFNYLAHFANLKQLFFSLNWGYGPSVGGPNDDVSLSAGPLHALLAMVGLLFVLKTKRKSLKPALLLMFLVFLGSLFLAHQRSAFIWKSLPFLSFIQFPWRFLVISVFASSILGAFVFEELPKSLAKKLILPFIVVVLLVYGSFFTPKEWFSLTDEEKLSGAFLQRQVTASIYDYLPKSAKYAPKGVAPETLIIVKGDVTITDSSRGTNWFSYLINVESDRAEVIIPTYDFPGWKVSVNGRPSIYERQGDLGLLGITVRRGENLVEARLTNSSPRKLGDILTILGMGTTLLLMAKEKKWLKL